jgi:hypothetical protein
VSGRIKCGHCSTVDVARFHETARDVLFCSQQSDPLRQTVTAANVKAEVTETRPHQAEPPPWPYKAPRAMVEAMRDGRYAVPWNSEMTFLRVSHPTTGKKKGCFVIQTQHSDWFEPVMVFYPTTGKVWFAKQGDRIDAALLGAAIDPVACALRYGQELGLCSRCGRELTDGRSRWYGIGPECEKHWPDLMNYVTETKGPWAG